VVIKFYFIESARLLSLSRRSLTDFGAPLLFSRSNLRDLRTPVLNKNVLNRQCDRMQAETKPLLWIKRWQKKRRN